MGDVTLDLHIVDTQVLLKSKHAWWRGTCYITYDWKTNLRLCRAVIKESRTGKVHHNQVDL